MNSDTSWASVCIWALSFCQSFATTGPQILFTQILGQRDLSRLKEKISGASNKNSTKAVTVGWPINMDASMPKPMPGSPELNVMSVKASSA
ncbi:hypothetical protein RB195_011188 [Necator americanus]|uniref:Uncharacterized protein n=1 Tax=Necator americanus TaxID=51031 RepID=A0ABR1D1B1_NECAM